MFYFMSFMLMALVVGLVAVASNPAPYFAAFGLVVAAVVGCGILAIFGGPFLSLVLLLIYLGGMLVVFAYSAALAAEPFPEAWGDRTVFGWILVYLFGVGLTSGFFWEDWCGNCWMEVGRLDWFSILQGDTSGVAIMYSFGGGMLIICAWVLLLSLLAVLELTRGLSRGALRAV
uniref:NADH-ubiquinone oxidoreductase chain 6 n=1 Tax=Garra flavatra TaxID=643389 RepID=V5XWK0_9TELE|nr:NADH dehydrogenase subunit 6 [Garra flavatra]BAO08999.1 NADH dehydrogenase subunit 6 [Garra flavatra]